MEVNDRLLTMTRCWLSGFLAMIGGKRAAVFLAPEVLGVVHLQDPVNSRNNTRNAC